MTLYQVLHLTGLMPMLGFPPPPPAKMLFSSHICTYPPPRPPLQYIAKLGHTMSIIIKAMQIMHWKHKSKGKCMMSSVKRLDKSCTITTLTFDVVNFILNSFPKRYNSHQLRYHIVHSGIDRLTLVHHL